MNQTNTIIFDLGGVLIDWNPRHLYRQIFDSEEKIDWFLENICDNAWNEEQDAGRSLLEATAIKIQEFPEYAEYIKAYYSRWTEMLGGPIDHSVEILSKLVADDNLRIYALTNWSAETFPVAKERFEFLNWFEGIVVSGEEKTRKPFPDIYHILLNRYHVNPREAIFIDDNIHNVEAASSIGIDGIHFTSSAEMQKALEKRKLI